VGVGEATIPAAIQFASENYPDPGDAGRVVAKVTGRLFLGIDVSLTYEHYRSKDVGPIESGVRTAAQKLGALGATALAVETENYGGTALD
jgi:hypothetical protein